MIRVTGDGGRAGCMRDGEFIHQANSVILNYFVIG